MCDDIVRRSVFYRLVEKRRDIYLTTFDYIFRYDPDWFWNVPETGFFNLFRRYAPERWRNSAFYTRYVAVKGRALGKLGMRDERTEPLIQDWEVPWRHGEELIRFAIDNVDLAGRPWAAVPIKAPRQPTLYPIQPTSCTSISGATAKFSGPTAWSRTTTRRSSTASASTSAASRCCTRRRS